MDAAARVLIVDDNAQYRQAFCRNLAVQGMEAIEAENADEALDRLKSDPPDVMVTDLQMRTATEGLDLIRGNALKVTVVLAFTPLALALFAWSGKVDWAMGFALAAGNLLGGLAGVRLQVLKGQKWVRGVVTVTIFLFAARLLISG